MGQYLEFFPGVPLIENLPFFECTGIDSEINNESEMPWYTHVHITGDFNLIKYQLTRNRKLPKSYFRTPNSYL